MKLWARKIVECLSHEKSTAYFPFSYVNRHILCFLVGMQCHSDKLLTERNKTFGTRIWRGLTKSSLGLIDSVRVRRVHHVDDSMRFGIILKAAFPQVSTVSLRRQYRAFVQRFWPMIQIHIFKNSNDIIVNSTKRRKCTKGKNKSGYLKWFWITRFQTR